MKLIIISSPNFFDKEAELANLLFQENLDLYHLRKPNAERDEIRNMLKLIPEEYHNKIILHSHYKLVNEFNLKGIHYTEKTKNEYENYSSYQCHKSVSCHTYKDVEMLNESFNYAFLSPIFDSISKTDYQSNFTDDSLKEYFKNRKNEISLIALGGITQDNICKVQDYGFKGAAILGSLWNKDLIKNQDRFISSFKLIQKKCQ